MSIELDNSHSLNLQLWSDRSEVKAAVDFIFDECTSAGLLVSKDRVCDVNAMVSMNRFRICSYCASHNSPDCIHSIELS